VTGDVPTHHRPVFVRLCYRVNARAFLQSKLILARDRVRFSGLHALWMLNALMLLLINWISLWLLEAIRHWSVGEIMVQLGWAIPQYFTCSLISMPVGNEEVIDMRLFYERQRPVLFSAFAVTYAMSMVANFADRNNLEGWKPGDWIGADLLVVPMLIAALVAGWAKPRWLQWTAAWFGLALQSWFLISSYTVGT
jgi:hypothetical protein